MPKRFPPHTVLLMLLALVAFGRMWCVSHPAKAPAGEGAGTPAPLKSPQTSPVEGAR